MWLTSMLGFVAHRNLRRAKECNLLLRWLAPRPGEAILDVGCGDGYQTMRIAAAGAEVVGIDINRRQLHKSWGLYRHPRSDCRCMNAEEMAFPPAHFDKVVSFCVIEHFSSNENVLRHIARVIKPGGLLVFSADSLSAAGISDRERDVHRQRYAVETFFDEATVREKLERHGFRLLKIRYILTSPLTVALCRASWRLERLGRAWKPLVGVSNLLLGTLGHPLAEWCDRRSRNDRGGLTLLVKAQRAGSSDPAPLP